MPASRALLLPALALALRPIAAAAAADAADADVETTCAVFCQAHRFGCNSAAAGSANQMLSCAQACHMRLALKLTWAQCHPHCARTPHSGCELTVAGHAYALCGRCARHEFTGPDDHVCTFGVCSNRACVEGCLVPEDFNANATAAEADTIKNDEAGNQKCGPFNKVVFYAGVVVMVLTIVVFFWVFWRREVAMRRFWRQVTPDLERLSHLDDVDNDHLDVDDLDLEDPVLDQALRREDAAARRGFAAHAEYQRGFDEGWNEGYDELLNDLGVFQVSGCVVSDNSPEAIAAAATAAYSPLAALGIVKKISLNETQFFGRWHLEDMELEEEARADWKELEENAKQLKKQKPPSSRASADVQLSRNCYICMQPCDTCGTCACKAAAHEACLARMWVTNRDLRECTICRTPYRTALQSLSQNKKK